MQDMSLAAGQPLREDHPGFVEKEAPYSCGKCVSWHADKYKFPRLQPENARAWEMYFRLQDQQRAGGFDVLGLDYAILPLAFRLYIVPPEEQRLLFEKIIVVNHEMNAHRSQRRESDRQLAEAKRLESQGVKRLDVMT